MIGIYMIFNTVNGKRYVGHSVRIEKRQKEHWSDLRRGTHHSIKLQNAWNKYGEEAFQFWVLEECQECDLAFLERRHMEWYDAYPNGYNMTPSTGCFSRGAKHSPEARAKIGAANTGKKLSPEHCAKMSAAMTGKKHSPEHCAKISAAQVGKKLSPEHCANMSAARKAQWQDPEYCAKMSAAQKRRWAKEALL